jgi:putative ABC transport system permease protein
MFRSLKYTLRIFKRNKLILGVNVIGLTFGLSLCLLLFAFINYETSYDKHFANSDRIVRVLNQWIEGDLIETDPICTRKAHTEVPLQIPEIEASTQIYRNWNTQMKVDNKTIANLAMLQVDTSFFNVFAIPFIFGNRQQPFNGPNSVILSAKTAQKAFGNINPVGQNIEIENKNYVVSAVTQELPNNTHFSYQVLLPMQSLLGLSEMQGLEFFTYYKMLNALTPATERKICTSYENILSVDFKEFNVVFKVMLEPLEEIHLFTQANFDLSPKGNTSKIWFVAVIALIVLFIAIFNCINLFVAFNRNRLTEIGIKKVIGAQASTITRQLITESFLINCFALVLAAFVALIAMPYFGVIMERSLSINSLFSGMGILLVVVTLALSTLASGLYPASLLAKYSNIEFLKGEKQNVNYSNPLSGILVSLQFAISIILLLGLLSVNKQIGFLKTKPLGFDAENVLVFSNFDRELSNHGEALKNDLLAIPSIQNVGFSAHRMGGGYSGQGIRLWGEEQDMTINEYRVQPGFCETFKLNLLWGRYFQQSELEREDIIILNQTAAEKLGVSELAQNYVNLYGTKTEVIAVVSDFSYKGSAYKIEPLMLSLVPVIRNISIRFNKSEVEVEKAKVVAIISKYSPDYIPIINSLAQVYNDKYGDEVRISKIIGYGGIIAMLISLMGVFAISIYNLQKRIKELGIRKVLGASTAELLTLELKNLLKWVFISVALALPLGSLLINKWFQNYPEHTTISISMYLSAALIPLLLAVLVVGWHCLNIARQNPVEALRYE